MDKQVINKIKQHREDYPNDDNTYITSDGMLFDEEGKMHAYDHAKSTPLVNVFIVPRAMDMEIWYNQTFALDDHGSGPSPLKMSFWLRIKLIWAYIFKTKK